MQNDLRLLAEDDTRVLIHDHPAAHDQMARFVGWEWDAAAGAFKKSAEPTTVRFDHVYVTAVKDGHLRPADAETAAVCGVPFNATAKSTKGQVSST